MEGNTCLHPFGDGILSDHLRTARRLDLNVTDKIHRAIALVHGDKQPRCRHRLIWRFQNAG